MMVDDDDGAFNAIKKAIADRVANLSIKTEKLTNGAFDANIKGIVESLPTVINNNRVLVATGKNHHHYVVTKPPENAKFKQGDRVFIELIEKLDCFEAAFHEKSTITIRVVPINYIAAVYK